MAQHRTMMDSDSSLGVEPLGMLDIEELPTSYGMDDVFVLFQKPSCVFVYFELTQNAKINAAQTLCKLADQVGCVLRMVTSFSDEFPSQDQPQKVEDFGVELGIGQRYIQTTPGRWIKISLGILTSEGQFASVVETSWVKLPSSLIQPKVSDQFLLKQSGTWQVISDQTIPLLAHQNSLGHGSGGLT